MENFQIEFDNPQAVYTPGQIVSGKVVLTARQPISAHFLKICFHGSAKTHWKEHEHQHRTDARGRRESFHEHVDYSATVPYLSGETIAWQSMNGSNKLPTGVNVFPFSFQVPLSCPPSFEGFHGSVRYSVHVELDRPWKFNKKSKKCFSVIPAYDLNVTPTAINPMVNSTSKNTGLLFKKGVVSMTVSLPKRGYVPGEVIPINVTIDNMSKKPVIAVRAKITQLSHYEAVRGHAECFTSYSHPHKHERKDEKMVAESRQNIGVPPCSKQQVVLSMRIPAIVPSFQCPIMSVNYCISVKLDTASSFGNTLKCEFPLIIGTIPIRQVVAVQQTLPSAPPVTMPSVSPTAPPYPVVGGQGPPVYPETSSGNSGVVGASAPTPSAPPSYEESVYGSGKVAEDTEPFAPRYPVYNNLMAPALPEKNGF